MITTAKLRYISLAVAVLSLLQQHTWTDEYRTTLISLHEHTETKGKLIERGGTDVTGEFWCQSVSDDTNTHSYSPHIQHRLCIHSCKTLQLLVVPLTVGKIWFPSIWTYLRITKSSYHKWPLLALKISPVRIKVCSSSVSPSSQDRQMSSLQVSIFSQQVSWHTSHILNKWVSDRGAVMRMWHLYDTQKQLSHFLTKTGRYAWKQRRSWSRVSSEKQQGDKDRLT